MEALSEFDTDDEGAGSGRVGEDRKMSEVESDPEYEMWADDGWKGLALAECRMWLKEAILTNKNRLGKFAQQTIVTRIPPGGRHMLARWIVICCPYR